jgi:hypothetical protein
MAQKVAQHVSQHIITLTIPDQLYQQVEQMAQGRRQTIAQVLSEHLIESFRPFPAPHISPNRYAMQREVEAYKRLHPEMVKQFLGHYVALYQGKVVDADPSEDALMQRRRQNYPGQVVLVRLVEAEVEVERELVLRSPRLVAS